MGEDLAPHLVCGWQCVFLEKGMATHSSIKGFPVSSAGKESICLQCRKHRFNYSVGKIYCRKNKLPTQFRGIPGDSDGKESACYSGDLGLIPGLGRPPWRRAWQPTPVLLPGESPWIEEPGRLQTMGLQRVRHNWLTGHSTVAMCWFETVIFGNWCLFVVEALGIKDYVRHLYWTRKWTFKEHKQIN